MTSEQRSEFERRIVQRAFDAGVCGCLADPVLCEVAADMGVDAEFSYSEWLAMFGSLVERGILRAEGVIPSDHLALSFEEWGKRIANSADAPFAPGMRDGYATWIATVLRGAT